MKFSLFVIVMLSLGANAGEIVVRNVDVYVANEVKKGVDVLVRDGILVAIDHNITANKNAHEVVGASVTSGLFNSSTHIGIEEISAIETTVDTTSINPRITAAHKVADSFNADSVLIAHNRTMGLTHALVLPESGAGLFAGQAALVNLNGKVINDSIAVVMSMNEGSHAFAGGSRSAALLLFREALDDALDFAANKDNVNRGNRRDYALSLHDLKALVPVVKAKKPLIVRVNRSDDIRRVMQIAKQYQLNIILADVTEGWKLGKALAGVPVIVDPIFNLPVSYESLASRLDNAQLMHNAGAILLFTGMGGENTHNAYLVRQSAGNAVANGLSKTTAINAMTSNPAKVFGFNRYGEIGQVANLVVWSGDPLEVSSEPELVIIDGKEITMSSRALSLRDRYFKRLQKTQ